MGYLDNFVHFGATYDNGTYGSCTYQGDCTSTQRVGAPDTGFLSQPEIVAPLILGSAVVIAATILVTKKIIRHLRHK